MIQMSSTDNNLSAEVMPVLYSFRRCPYCMRAHMALKYSGLKVELREVDLWNLPDEALAVSPEKTVPVLVTDNNHAIDESWDIVKWAVQKNDPDNWLGKNNEYLNDAEMLIETNDFSFKNDLDRYKYADRHPEHTQEYYRQQGEEFLEELEEMLAENTYLLANHLTIADIGVAPFIRQFSMVDSEWFETSPYPLLRKWLNRLLTSELFAVALAKHPIWSNTDDTKYLQRICCRIFLHLFFS